MAADAVRGTRRSNRDAQRPTRKRFPGLTPMRVVECTRARCRCRSVVRLACGCENHTGGELFHCALHEAALYFVRLAAALPCRGRQECSPSLPCDGCRARALLLTAPPSTVGQAPPVADRP